MQDSTQCRVYHEGQAPREITLDEVSNFVDDGRNFILIDMQTPGSELLAKLGDELNFHELTLEDALTTPPATQAGGVWRLSVHQLQSRCTHGGAYSLGPKLRCCRGAEAMN